MSLLSPQLIAFLAVVRAKTVHGAAEKIHLTQTAVTQRIRALEQSLNTTLFIRSRRGMLLTPEGEALLRYCNAAKDLEGEALAIIQGAGVDTSIEIKISAPSSIMRARVLDACLPIMKNYPNLLFHFHVDDMERRHQALRAGECDLAIIREEHLAQEMKHKRLLPEQYVLAASYPWKNRDLKDIICNERIIDFDPSDQMTLGYLKKYHLFKHARHERYFVNQTENLAHLVMEGVGYSTFAKEFVEPYVKEKKLVILNQSKTYDVIPVLAWFDRPEPPSYFTAIINAIN